MQDDDFSLFSQQMRGVKRIQHDRADVGKPRADRQQVVSRRQNATQRQSSSGINALEH